MFTQPIVISQFYRVLKKRVHMFKEGDSLNRQKIDGYASFKVGLWPSKKLFYFLQWKTFKNDENCFLLRFGILVLPNRITQNDVTLRVTDSKIFIEILLSSN